MRLDYFLINILLKWAKHFRNGSLASKICIGARKYGRYDIRTKEAKQMLKQSGICKFYGDENKEQRFDWANEYLGYLKYPQLLEGDIVWEKKKVIEELKEILNVELGVFHTIIIGFIVSMIAGMLVTVIV